MDRRAIIRMFGLGAVAGPTVGRKALEGALAAPVGSVASSTVESCEPQNGGYVGPPSYEVYERLFDMRNQASHRVGEGTGPVSIMTKRSWSPAFKEHCCYKQLALQHEVNKRLREDDEFRLKLAGLLGMVE